MSSANTMVRGVRNTGSTVPGRVIGPSDSADQVAPIDGEIAVTAPIQILSDELSFGSQAAENGQPVGSGLLGWNMNDVTCTFQPFVSGYLHFNNAAGVRAGIQLTIESFWGERLSRTIYRVPVVDTQDHQVSAAIFHLPPTATAEAYKANVSIVIDVSDHDTAEADWRWVAGQNFYLFEPGATVEDVKLQTAKFDFGGSLWHDGAPVNSGTLTWDTNSGANGTSTTPRLSGYLHVENANTINVAVRMRVYDRCGQLVDEPVFSNTYDIPDDGYHRYRIQLDGPTDTTIHEARVAIVIDDDGQWERQAVKTFYL